MTPSQHESPEDTEGLPIITQLDGFPDPVRDPDTGMIIPQTRRERKALEAAQQEAARKAELKAAQKKAQGDVATGEVEQVAEEPEALEPEAPEAEAVAEDTEADNAVETDEPLEEFVPSDDEADESSDELEAETEESAEDDLDTPTASPVQGEVFVTDAVQAEDEFPVPEPVPVTAPVATVASSTGEGLTEESADLSEAEPAKKESRAGRNLLAATLTGVVLLGAAVVGIFFEPLVLAVLIVALLGVGTWELHKAFQHRDIDTPLIPLWVGGLAMPISAWLVGVDGLIFALFGSLLLALAWTMLGEYPRPMLSLSATSQIMLWVPFLLSFGLLILQEPGGQAMFLTMILLAVSNDIFGYIFGVLWGKHPMAPRISPKKSWEGFSGSLIGAITVGILCSVYLLHQPWWLGAVLGALIVPAATAGDFVASMFKRDVGIKDMGKSLPGHGGVMDRLDSIAFAAPVAFTVFMVLMP